MPTTSNSEYTEYSDEEEDAYSDSSRSQGSNDLEAETMPASGQADLDSPVESEGDGDGGDDGSPVDEADEEGDEYTDSVAINAINGVDQEALQLMIEMLLKGQIKIPAKVARAQAVRSKVRLIFLIHFPPYSFSSFLFLLLLMPPPLPPPLPPPPPPPPPPPCCI